MYFTTRRLCVIAYLCILFRLVLKKPATITNCALLVSLTGTIVVSVGFQYRAAATGNVGLGSADGSFEKDRIKKELGEPNSREFTYFMLGGARFVYASAVRLALIKVWLIRICLRSSSNVEFII